MTDRNYIQMAEIASVSHHPNPGFADFTRYVIGAEGFASSSGVVQDHEYILVHLSSDAAESVQVATAYPDEEPTELRSLVRDFKHLLRRYDEAELEIEHQAAWDELMRVAGMENDKA